MAHSFVIADLESRLAALREAYGMLSGVVAAMEVAVIALSEAHPDPIAFQARLQLGFETMESMLLAQSPSDPMLLQFQAVRSRFPGQSPSPVPRSGDAPE